MPRKMSDEEFALLPLERQKVILYDRERSKKNREQRLERNKKYYEKNKDTFKEYREKNKAKIKIHNKVYKRENKEKLKLKQKEYNEKNKKYLRERQKIYYQTDAGIKHSRINSWKSSGFKHTREQFDAIYAKYQEATECELCSVTLVMGNNSNDTKCADHDHLSGCFRNVVCHTCNMHLAKKDNIREILMLELHRFFDSKK